MGTSLFEKVLTVKELFWGVNCCWLQVLVVLGVNLFLSFTEFCANFADSKVLSIGFSGGFWLNISKRSDHPIRSSSL